MTNWKPGDLALCVRDQSPPPGFGYREPNECSSVVSMLFPRIGSEWRVDAVELHFREIEQRTLVYLKLAGQPSDYAYDARCFRKLEKHEADAEDAETIALLNRSKKQVKA